MQDIKLVKFIIPIGIKLSTKQCPNTQEDNIEKR